MLYIIYIIFYTIYNLSTYNIYTIYLYTIYTIYLYTLYTLYTISMYSTYFSHLDSNGQRRDKEQRPELSRCSVEFVAPGDYMVRRKDQSIVYIEYIEYIEYLIYSI
jgi:hypothetical protein